MDLGTYWQSLAVSQREYHFGRRSEDPLAHAFDGKHVVHAGLQGQVIPPPVAQAAWQQQMQTAVTGHPSRLAYIHIPFCKTKCLYCGFFQNGTDQAEEDRYIGALVEELEEAGRAPCVTGAPFQAVFLGGGTPSSLSPDNAALLLGTIRRCLPLANDYELTLEGRIRDVVPEKIETWLRGGVNRVSLGVQSFDTKVRRQVGRLDGEDEVLARLDLLHSYNGCATVVDLMFGLPDQTPAVWQHDLDTFARSGADGCDLYQLNVFEESALAAAIRNGNLSPAATTEEQGRLFLQGRETMQRYGFRRLSHCHWAKDNRERSLYNTLARSGCDLFPFGCGAGGHVGPLAGMLHRSLKGYGEMVRRGWKPFMVLSCQSPFAALEGRVQSQMEQCCFDLEGLIRLEPRLAGLRWLGSLWEGYGLWRNNGVRYQLTPAGEFWLVNMTQTLLESLAILLDAPQAPAGRPV